jgi:hypothetical protein
LLDEFWLPVPMFVLGLTFVFGLTLIDEPPGVVPLTLGVDTCAAVGPTPTTNAANDAAANRAPELDALGLRTQDQRTPRRPGDGTPRRCSRSGASRVDATIPARNSGENDHCAEDNGQHAGDPPQAAAPLHYDRPPPRRTASVLAGLPAGS